MQYVRFGNTPMEVSRLCLGGMMFSRKLDLDASRQVVNEALAAGINFIDTAESYGQSEEFLGHILQGRRDSVFLATKVWTRRASGNCGRNSRVNIIHSLQRSLRLLRTDHVDLYQLHHPDAETPLEETLSTLDQMVKEGKTRYLGVSNHYAWQMAHMIGQANRHAWEPIVSIQCSYSIVDRPIEIETVPMAQRFNLAIMGYYPLRAGVLSGKYEQGKAIGDDWRAQQDPKLQRLLQKPSLWELLGKLRPIADRNGLKLNQLAILWLLAKSHLSTAIIGGSKLKHFREIYAVADKCLPEDDVQQINELSREFVYKPFVNQPISAGPELSEQW